MEKHTFVTWGVRAALLGLLPVSGCLIYSHDTHYREKGKPVSSRTLDQIQCGATTKDWVLATFGAPSQQSTAPGGVEVLEYRYVQKKDNQLLVLPFVIVDDEGENTQTLHFEITNGIVTNFWKEDRKD